MATVNVGQENNSDIEVDEDHGAGQPVLLMHGYPISGRAWDIPWTHAAQVDTARLDFIRS